MEFFTKTLKQLSEFFSKVEPGTKLLSLLFGLVLIAAVFIAVFMNRQADMALVYSNLSEATAADIVRVLDDNSVGYQLKNNGRNIYVKKDQANRVRLLLKGKGLPKDGDRVGYEIFDRSSLGVTDFVQNIQHHRALAGELERTIGGIRGVEGVRVHIVLPEEKLFEKDKLETTATILLTLQQEGILDTPQIDGIRQLTASSVEGLKSKNITIVDNFGNILAASQDTDENISGVMTSRMSLQRNVEGYYIKKVQTLLDSVLGVNNSVVRVDALLDFDKIEETEEKYDPESAVVRSEVITSEKASGSTNASKGPPGVQSNMTPGAKGSGSNTQENQTNREVLNNKYEIDKKIRHIVKSVGDVKKLTVSVFLKQKFRVDKDGKPVVGEDGKTQYDPRPGEEIKTFTDIVTSAIGFDSERGDKVVIKEVPFDKKPGFADFPKSSILSGDVNTLVVPAVKFAVLGGLLVLFTSLLKKKMGSDSERGGRSSGAEGSTSVPGEKTGASGTGEEPGGGLADLQARGLRAVEKGAFVESEIGKLVDNFPNETELVLKKWLKGT